MKIRICDSNLCIGCGNCSNICPTKAISVELNEEGFYKAKVHEACTGCGRCKEVCPVLQEIGKQEENSETKYYITQADKHIREQSSSGGMFRIMADYVLGRDGYVAGAIWTNHNKVKHILSNELEDIIKMQESKYAQSELGNVFEEIKEKLQSHFLVMFTGMPCQVSALLAYLGRRYENLILVDLVCHGMPSQTVLWKYLEEQFPGKEIQRVSFREKTLLGWSTSMNIYFEDGSVYRRRPEEDLWYKIFLDNLSLGTQCGEACRYSKPEREADITIGDFWGLHAYEKRENYDDGRGTSVISVNSKQGQLLFDKIKNKLEKWDAVSMEEAAHGNCLLRPAEINVWKRQRFFKDIKNTTLEIAYDYSKNEKTDIALVGLWFTKNYGGAITAWAFYKTLSDLGYRVQFIDLLNADFIGDRNGEIESFVRSRCNISRIYKDTIDLLEINDQCDTFIVGSDQCWRSGFVKLYGYNMYLDFVMDSKKKISYATSFATDHYEGDFTEKSKVGMYLKRFDYVSVREAASVKMCEKEFDVKAKFVLDPVFLVDKKHYEEEIEAVPLISTEPYILNYNLDINENLLRLHKIVAEKLGKKTYSILGSDYSNVYGLEVPNKLEDVSVPKLMSAYYHADYIFTDSFHGMCLAIIFQKPFTVVINDARGRERFLSLLHYLELEERSCELHNCEKDLVIVDPVDWNKVNEKLESFRNESFEWLKNALKDQKEKPLQYNEVMFSTLASRLHDDEQKIASLNQKIETLERSIIERREKEICRYFDTRLKKNAKVAFRGSGYHTMRLLKTLQEIIRRKNIKVEYLIDRSNKVLFKELEQYRVVSPEQLDVKDLDAIIISSSKYHADFLKELENNHGKAEVLDLYTELTDGIKEGQAYYEFE